MAVSYMVGRPVLPRQKSTTHGPAACTAPSRSPPAMCTLIYSADGRLMNEENLSFEELDLFGLQSYRHHCASGLYPFLDPTGATRRAISHYRTQQGVAVIGHNSHRTARATTGPHDRSRLAASLHPPPWRWPSPR